MSNTDKYDKTAFDPQYFECKLQIEPVEQAIVQLSSSELIPRGEAFLTNLRNIHGLIHVPDTIIQTGVRNTLWAIYFSKTYSLDLMKLIEDVTDALRGKRKSEDLEYGPMSESDRLARAHSMLHEFLKREGSRDRIARLIEGMFLELTGQKEFQEAARVLLMSTTTFLWTAFECLATDCWIVALNSGSTNLAHKTLRELPASDEPDGISSKHIEVAVLAKYGFDVKNKLGTILSRKFKFSSLEGIREAYAAAFQDRQAIDRILGGQELSLLESSRHLIVHRSGIIDEKFLKRNPTVCQNAEEVLNLDGHMVSRFGTAIGESGTRLLRYLDGRIQTERRPSGETRDSSTSMPPNLGLF